MLDTVTFVEHGGKTTLTLTAGVVKTGPRSGSTEWTRARTRAWTVSRPTRRAWRAKIIQVSILKKRGENHMQTITPFLWFDGKAEEAMIFYTSIFKDSKIVGVTRYGEGGPGMGR